MSRGNEGTRGKASHAGGIGRRFRWNVVNLVLVGVVIIAGLIAGIALLSRKGGVGGAPGVTDSVAAPQLAAPTPGNTLEPAESLRTASGAGASPGPTAAEASAGASSEYFTSGGVQVDATTYRSGDLYVKVTNVNKDGVNYYVADCRMKDPGKLFAALAFDKYALHKAEKASVMAERKGAVIAINGDYYGFRPEGIVLRNGTLYRKTPFNDVAAIYGDGTMKTLAKDEADADRLGQDGARQVFSFGPMLLDADGKAFPEADMKRRLPKVNPVNPRAGIGYIEPNHFVLVVVDGRGAGGSRGLTQTEFSRLFESLGCKSAYNFDGGGSATMVFMGKVINHPCDDGGERPVSDIVYFGESETDPANIGRINQR